MCNSSTLYVQFAKKIEMSSIIPSASHVKIGHVTLTTATWEMVSYHKANTSRGQLVYEI